MLQSNNVRHNAVASFMLPFGAVLVVQLSNLGHFILKGYDMKIVRALILTTLIVSTLLIMFICGAAIAGYVAPEFAFALLPYVGMVIILGIWYPY
jgi:hypothetical protein